MARGLSSSVKTELATGNIAPVHLIDLNFSTPQYLTDCSFNLTSSISGTSRIYTASGHILNIGNAQEGSKPIKNSFNLTLSGVDQSFVSIALNENITTANLGLSVTSHWGNFEKVSGRRTSDTSQQRFFSGDKGFEFSALTVQDIRWGRE